MDIVLFESIVTQRRDSLIAMGVLMLAACLAGFLIIELFVRRKLELRYVYLGKLRLSPSWILLPLCLAVVIFYGLQIRNCQLDLQQDSYVSYVGDLEYDYNTVTLLHDGQKLLVGKYYEGISEGSHYGKCIYSKHARVIVYWEPIPGEEDTAQGCSYVSTRRWSFEV